MRDDEGPEADEELELFRRYRETGDLAIRNELFSRYLTLVESVMRGAGRAFLGEKEDLAQVGYLGLLAAIERFDVERGVKFSTYAGHCVNGEIRHFVRDKSESIRRPRWMKKLSRQVAIFLESHLQEHARLPTLREISDSLNISEEGVVAVLRAKQPLSLEDEGSVVHGRASLEAIRSLRYVSFQLPIEDRIAIGQAFERLLALEQKVIYLFFVQDLTQKQIAGKLALSPRKVSRLMQKALERLRGWLDSGENSGEERK